MTAALTLAKLYQAREALRGFYQGDEYAAFLKDWIAGLRRLMAAKPCSAVEAMGHVLIEGKNTDADFGALAITVMAATLEIYEEDARKTVQMRHS